MTPPHDLLLLDNADVQALLTHDNTLRCVRRAFEAHSARSGRTFPLVRESLGGQTVFGIKSGDIAADQALGLKVAGFWPANRALGKDAHQATILLMDPATGRPLGLFDGNHVTAMRTGAAGGIGIQQLARPDSRRLCLFGSGVQARIQLDYALRVCPSLTQVDYVTAQGQPNPALEALFRPRCDITHAPNADTAVARADIVVTATPSRQPLFSRAAVRPGTHINAVGADTKGKRELPEGLLEQALLVIDDTAQARQLGEAQWAPADYPLREIGTLLPDTSDTDWQRPADAITVFDMTGIALQDLTVAQSLYALAGAHGRGRRMAWPW
nr:ornithine cyclodeaminase family protein [uncultured Albidiferax sp.]